MGIDTLDIETILSSLVDKIVHSFLSLLLLSMLPKAESSAPQYIAW
jgi:hypothetical protein